MNIIPKKSLGQNFLINEGILRKIVDAADLTSNDTVLEVGPGTGNLTRLLAERAGSVIAVEKDHRLIESLREQFADAANVKIVEADVLEVEPPWEVQPPYKIVANIPYYITSHFLRTVFEKWPRPQVIVLTIQKEVARRIMAHPPDMSILALSVQYYAEPEIIADVSRGSFRPMPKVDSAVIRLIPHDVHPDPKLFALIRAGFSSKRKKLASNIATGRGFPKEAITAAFERAGIPADARAEMLSLEQWKVLLDELGMPPDA